MKTTAVLAILIFLLLPSLGFSYEEVAVANGGTIKGRVKLTGKAPKLPPLDITKFKEVCQNVPNETLVLGPGQGIRYAVVTLEGIAKGQAVEREVVHELDNVKCRFVPHVLAASVGQFLLLKNTDPILHTAHAFFHDGQPQFNIGLYPGRVSRKPLLNAGVVKILCEVHSWMSSYVVVTEHPYHAVSDMYGDYDIRDVPPGVYKLKVWHESLGVQERQVEVKAAGVSQVDFDLAQAPGAKK
jgi:plastocyanin